MTNNNLKKKAASGMIWTALQRYSTMLMQFISGIILARLLTPHDYGCIGMLAIFMVLAESFIDGGFGSALIQKKRPTQEDYSTIFFWNIGMSVILYAVLYVSAPLIAKFYNIPLLCDVLRVQGIILFIYAFNIVQRNQLQKNLNFKVLSVVTITTSIISLSITIFMAYRGYGAWSLVVQNILTAAIPAFVFWFCIKWRPQLIFSWQSFRELFGFGFYMFLTNILNQFGNQIQGLLIGKFFTPTTMGLYSKAWHTEKLASTSLSQIMTQVTYPIYAEVQDDKKKLSNIIKNLTLAVSYFSFPIMFVLILCAKPLIVLLYSEKWLGSVPYFQILCLAGIAYSLQSINYQSIAAIGEGRLMFIWTLVKRLMGLLFVLVGLLIWGMNGLLIGIVANTWFSYLVNIALVSKYVGYMWFNQLKDIMCVFFVSILIAIVCFIIIPLFNLTLYRECILYLLAYSTIYIAWSFVFKPKAFQLFKNTLLFFINNFKAKLSFNKI